MVDLETACITAWEAAAAATPAAAMHFSEVFELKSCMLPSAAAQAQHADAASALQKLMALGTKSEPSTSPTSSDAVTKAWASACAPVLKPLPVQAPQDAHLMTKAFEGAYAVARTELAKLGSQASQPPHPPNHAHTFPS